MPRNPHKRRCQSPGCRAYAMRQLPDGAPADYCRSHLDPILGPRQAGPPKGNTNALKTGRYAFPVPKDKLDKLAFDLAQDPDRLPIFLAHQFKILHEGTGDVFKAFILYYRFLQQLLPAFWL